MMEAGRELDALVAEKVMGRYVCRCLENGAVCPATSTPHYSTDIAAAWQVVEYLNAQRWTMKVLLYLDGSSSVAMKRSGSVDSGEELIDIGERYGKSVPLAICRAALAAMSNSEEA